MKPEVIFRIETTKLEQDLENAALIQAKRGNWIEFPDQEHGTGYRVILLADNAWLPVNLPPNFIRYDPGTTPLMRAALLGDAERMRALVNQKADVTATSKDGTTALVYAAASDNPLAVDMLLKAGAGTNVLAKSGDSALAAAVATNHPENVALLLRAGASPNSRNSEGESVLSIAVRNRYAQIVEMLKAAGARQQSREVGTRTGGWPRLSIR